MVENLSLRHRNRLAAMRLVQATAVAMFEEQDFTGVTIEEIAETCKVSPSTIYRHFGTKENVVLWDERDTIVDEQLAERLGTQKPIHAFRDAVVVALAERDDSELFLRRLRLTYAEASIWGAAAEQDLHHRRALAAAIASTVGRKQANLTDECTAAACLVALDVALDNWQRNNGRPALADLIDQAVAAAADLD